MCERGAACVRERQLSLVMIPWARACACMCLQVACAEDHMVGLTSDGEVMAPPPPSTTRAHACQLLHLTASISLSRAPALSSVPTSVRVCACLPPTTQVLSWGRACNGRLGSELPMDALTPAMAATTVAAASRSGTARVVPGARRGATAGGSPGGAATVRHVALPFLEGLEFLGEASDNARERHKARERHTAREGGFTGSSSADEAVPPPRVSAVCCGGAHTLVLCGVQCLPHATVDGKADGAPRRSRVNASDCSLLWEGVPLASESGGGSSGRPGSSEASRRIRAVAGVPFALRVLVRDTMGAESALPTGASFTTMLRPRRVLAAEAREVGSADGSPDGWPAIPTPLTPTVTHLAGGEYEVSRRGAPNEHSHVVAQLTRAKRPWLMCPVRAAQVSCECNVAGGYELHVALCGSRGRRKRGMRTGTVERDAAVGGEGEGGGLHVCGSPASVLVSAADVSPEHCTLSAPCLASGTAVAGEAQTLVVCARDRFGNRVAANANAAKGSQGSDEGGLEVLVRAHGAATSELLAVSELHVANEVAAERTGTHRAQFMPRVAGRMALLCRLRGEAIGDTPTFIDVQPAAACAASCRVQCVDGIDSGMRGTVGEALSMTIEARDAFGNARPTGGDALTAHVDAVQPSRSGAASVATGFPLKLAPLDGGVYIATGTPPATGRFHVVVILNGSERLPCTPLKLDVRESDISPPAVTDSAPVDGARDLGTDRALRWTSVHLELYPNGVRAAVCDEPSTFDVLMKLQSADGGGSDDGDDSMRRTAAAAAAARAVRCTYSGADSGEAAFVTVSADGERLTFEWTPRRPGAITMHAELVLASTETVTDEGRPRVSAVGRRQDLTSCPPLRAHVSVDGVRAFARTPFTFYQLGVVSAAEPLMPLPPEYYDMPTEPPAGSASSAVAARPFGTLDELRASPADELPEVLVVDVATDSGLRARRDEAQALLARVPAAARPSMLALLVSSWLGGHSRAAGGPAHSRTAGENGRRGGADEQRAAEESRMWRAQHGTNVRPLGVVSCGGLRPRALLYKLLHDEVVVPLSGGAAADTLHAGGCRLVRARDGALQCWLHMRDTSAAGHSPRAAVSLPWGASAHPPGATLVDLFCDW